jgi:hypothetical protein
MYTRTRSSPPTQHPPAPTSTTPIPPIGSGKCGRHLGVVDSRYRMSEPLPNESSAGKANESRPRRAAPCGPVLIFRADGRYFSRADLIEMDGLWRQKVSSVDIAGRYGLRPGSLLNLVARGRNAQPGLFPVRKVRNPTLYTSRLAEIEAFCAAGHTLAEACRRYQVPYDLAWRKGLKRTKGVFRLGLLSLVQVTEFMARPAATYARLAETAGVSKTTALNFCRKLTPSGAP